MSVARARVVVELGDLRAALVSVRPHIAAEVDGIPPALQRMRVTITPDLVWCSATDRYTAGLGIVSVWEDQTRTGESIDIDLSAGDVRDIIATFRPAKPVVADEKVLLTVTDGALTVTDASGLFADGSKSLTLPVGEHAPILAPGGTASSGGFPDLPRMLSRMLANALEFAAQDLVSNTGALWVAPGLLRRFVPAGETTGALQLRPTSEARSALLVTAGDSFLGALMPQNPAEEALLTHAGYLRGWRNRLPAPAPVELLTTFPTTPTDDDMPGGGDE